MFHFLQLDRIDEPAENWIADPRSLFIAKRGSIAGGRGDSFFIYISFAGQIWQKYRKAGGKRTRILADFLICAQAENHAEQLLTRDHGFYKKYFNSENSAISARDRKILKLSFFYKAKTINEGLITQSSFIKVMQVPHERTRNLIFPV